MSVETSGKVRLYATEALDPAAELTDELCIFCNHEINLTTSKQKKCQPRLVMITDIYNSAKYCTIKSFINNLY
jgi:hypothetical protein